MKPHKPDYLFLSLAAIIILFGLLMLSSASTVTSLKDKGDSYYYLKHQFLNGLLPGILFFFVFLNINYQKLRFWAPYFFIFSLGLLVLVFVPGLEIANSSAKSWINLRFFSFQPAEIAKLAYIIYLACWLEKRSLEEIKDFSLSFLPFVAILALICSLVILQPDIGTMSVIALTAIVIYFVAGARFSHLFALGILAVGSLAVLIKIAPYRLQRLTTFLNPELDPRGIGYHINQALLAIGSGGFWGRGFGLSRQKFQYLPEPVGDSIFAIIAEELGFFFSVGLVLLFLMLFLRGYKIAKNSPDRFAKFLIVGIVSWFMVQAFVNIGAIVGLLPLTGVPLIFISYGGTSLAVSLAAVGLVANISRYTVK